MTGKFQRAFERLRELVGRSPRQSPLPGEARTLSGLEAIAEVERRIGATTAGGDDARSILAAATGIAMGGVRATATLDGGQLAGASELLTSAAGRQAPLVAHVVSRAQSGHAQALGSGHGSWHAVADTGWIQLFATNVQEAVDLTLVARRVTEKTLVPVLVGMDAAETAYSVQEVELPSSELLAGYLGNADDTIEAPTAAQLQLFGATRARVPRWFDLDHPALFGSTQGPEAWAIGAAGRRPFVLGHVPALLDEAADALEALTARPCGALATEGLFSAKVVLVAQGSTIETASAVATYLRKQEKLKVGVLGIRCLRPLPTEGLLKHLRDRTLIVLERTDAPLAGEAPLLRELRSAVMRALEAGAKASDLPSFRSALCGLGGAPVRAADLAELCRRGADLGPVTYPGLELAHVAPQYPKREAAAAELERHYPAARELGLRAKGPAPDVRPAGTLTVAIHRNSGSDAVGLEAALGRLLRDTLGGGVRTRRDLTGDGYDLPSVDRVVFSTVDVVEDPGADAPVDVAVIASPWPHPLTRAADRLVSGGLVLVAAEGDDASISGRLPGPLARALASQGAKTKALAETSVPTADSDGRLLGALAGALRDRLGLDIGDRALIAARRKALEGTESAEQAATAFEAGLTAGVRELGITPAEGARDRSERAMPAAVELLGGDRVGPASLPRFWDQIGVLYRRGETSLLTADPWMAAGCVPPLTATLRAVSDARSLLPVFDPARCTGCSKCWTACPDGAIGALAVGFTGLLEAGIDRVDAAGGAGGPLRAIASKVGGLATRQLKKAAPDALPATTGQALTDAFEAVMEKAKFPDERATGIRQAFEAVRGVVGDLPVSRTAPFFDASEAASPGAGEVLSLAINPDTCKGCSACVAACDDNALSAATPTTARVEAGRRLWSAWERLPDTAGATIARVRRDPAVGTAGAIQLSRHCLLALAGADDAAPGSGEKVALRLALGAAEFHYQPLALHRLDELKQLRSALATRIQEAVARTVPTADSAAMQELAGLAGRRDVGLGELGRRLEAAGVGAASGVGAPELGRLAALTRELDELAWRLREGPSGRGRARFGVVVAAGATARWTGAFPYNSFSCPTVIDPTGNAAPLALGLARELVSEAVREAGLLRRARGAAKGASAAEDDIPTTWGDLTPAEQAFCPPLLLVLGPGAEETLSHARDLLYSGLKLVVLVLTDRASDPDGAPDEWADIGLAALGQGPAYVLQSSIAARDHLTDGLLRALLFAGPSLVHVHAPVPTRRGAPTDSAVSLAQAALETRRFPAFRFDPTQEGVLGACLELEDSGPAGEANGSPRQWRMLKEIEGLETPAAARLEAKVREELESEHRATLADKEAAARALLAEQRASSDAETIARVRQRLLQMAGYGD